MSELSLQYPLLLLALPLFFVLRYITKKRSSASIPSGTLLLHHPVRSLYQTLSPYLLGVIHFLFLLALVLAATKPVKKESISPGESERRNIFLALDVSRSMEAKDFQSPYGVLRRIDGVKTVTKRFFSERAEDRIGLVLFGSHAFLQAPLTIDHELLTSIVSDLQVGIAGDGTALGDGLGVALKRISELPGKTKAIILITDGVSNSGQVEPLKAARIASELDVRVYTIGIGSREGGFIELQSRGMRIPQRVHADFDEATLKEIADTTGAKYYFASDLNKLDQIFREIELLELSEREEKSFVRYTEYYHLFAELAALLFLLHFVLSQTLSRVYP